VREGRKNKRRAVEKRKQWKKGDTIYFREKRDRHFLECTILQRKEGEASNGEKFSTWAILLLM
jgi:ASC-1-like (ASCH) protein